MSANSLETLIKLGTPFVNPFYKAVVGILYLETIIMQDLDKYLADYKLTYQQFKVAKQNADRQAQEVIYCSLTAASPETQLNKNIH